MKRRFFGGDTLIEVMFAIGLFSVIVVGTVSIMSGGTSKVQNSLEVTMTRNEIDAEAEALRYIQSSYIAERDLGDGAQTYRKLWNDIKSLAVNDNKAISAGQLNDILDYNPATCSELYDPNGEAMKYGFVLNHRMLDNASITGYNSNSNNGVLLIGKKYGKMFRQTQTYPRLLFSDSDAMYSNVGGNNKVTAAEGLYVVAVRDTGTTTSVQEGSKTTTTTSAFYDFYIRSCWEGPNSAAPTLTSTVVRLYDPDIGVIDYKATTYVVEYNDNGGTWPSGRPATVAQDSFDKNFSVTLTNQKPTRSGYDFLGFQIDNPNYPGNKKLMNPGDRMTLTSDHSTVVVYPVWGHLVNFTAKVDNSRFGTVSAESNYCGKVTGSSVTIKIPENDRVVANVETVSKGFVFSDWYRGESFENNQRKYSLNVPSAITLTAKFAQDVTAIERIRVLNVYPYSGANLKAWMETNGYGKVNGKQVIQVTNVSIGFFPGSYSVDSFDVVVFGFWDCNSSTDMSNAGANWMDKWVAAKKPVIFGHDTLEGALICGYHNNFNRYSSYVGLDTSSYPRRTEWESTGNTSSSVKITKDSTFTKYPWDIGNAGKILYIPTSHDLGQKVINTDNIFLTFTSQSRASTKADNFYLVVNGTGAMIQTGHSSGAATVDEQKILANLIFYLYSQYVIK